MLPPLRLVFGVYQKNGPRTGGPENLLRLTELNTIRYFQFHFPPSLGGEPAAAIAIRRPRASRPLASRDRIVRIAPRGSRTV